MSTINNLAHIAQHQLAARVIVEPKTLNQLQKNQNLLQGGLDGLRLGTHQDVFQRFQQAGAKVKFKFDKSQGNFYLRPKTATGHKLPRILLNKEYNHNFQVSQYHQVVQQTDHAIAQARAVQGKHAGHRQYRPIPHPPQQPINNTALPNGSKADGLGWGVSSLFSLVGALLI